MENASKALIIAGSILIAIMIISLGILLLNKMGGSAKNAANMDEQKITPYIGKAVSGSQVNTLIQYVISINQSAVSSKDATKSLSITYPLDATGTNTNTISLDQSNDPWKVSGLGSQKRVQTGASKFYTVMVENGADGLIETITVTQNP